MDGVLEALRPWAILHHARRSCRRVHVLVTGANGYIGGRLVPRLLDAGHQVRVMVRDASRIEGFAWSHDVDVHIGDVTDPSSLDGCCDGIDAAYYLIHRMTDSKDFQEEDRLAAWAFAKAAKGTHIIYLGGLQPKGDASAHLASRAEVGQELAVGPITEFRAGPVIGSGSASFEMTRYLTERLPVMVTPKWVRNDVQPIAVRDVLAYLVAALDVEPAGIVDIGGEVLPFRQMMHRYARIRGLRRLIMPVPVLAPTLAGRWVQFITPIPNKLAIPLLAGIVHPVTADVTRARELFPQIEPLGYDDAVRLALQRMADDEVETRWSGAGDHGFVLTDWENLKQESRSVYVDATPEQVFAVVASLGGERGWLAWNWAWRLRGAMDRMVGGPGLRQGRRSRRTLRIGERVDFWRVEALEPGRLLRLRAEMKLPGKAWLQFETEPEDGGARLTQTALYEPRGLFGPSYWWAVYPVHRPLFAAMTRAIAKEAG